MLSFDRKIKTQQLEGRGVQNWKRIRRLVVHPQTHRQDFWRQTVPVRTKCCRSEPFAHNPTWKLFPRGALQEKGRRQKLNSKKECLGESKATDRDKCRRYRQLFANSSWISVRISKQVSTGRRTSVMEGRSIALAGLGRAIGEGSGDIPTPLAVSMVKALSPQSRFSTSSSWCQGHATHPQLKHTQHTRTVIREDLHRGESGGRKWATQRTSNGLTVYVYVNDVGGWGDMEGDSEPCQGSHCATTAGVSETTLLKRQHGRCSSCAAFGWSPDPPHPGRSGAPLGGAPTCSPRRWVPIPGFAGRPRPLGVPLAEGWWTLSGHCHWEMFPCSCREQDLRMGFCHPGVGMEAPEPPQRASLAPQRVVDAHQHWIP